MMDEVSSGACLDYKLKNQFQIDNLRLDLNSTKAFELIAKDIAKTNFLEWTGLSTLYTVKVKSIRK